MTPPFRALRVLITNIRLDGRSGTEIVTRNLAVGLKAAGHLPMVYSPHLGPIAEELRSQGIPVLSRIEQIRTDPDIIHGHHVIQTGVAAARFPHVPGIFVCHDFTAWHDEPPLLDNILHYVAVGDATRDRLTVESGIDASRLSLVENATDMQLYLPGPPAPSRPRKALVMLKGAAQLAPIEAACQERGIQLDVAGAATGRPHEHPEQLFPEYDLVFASGLTAIEAMACLRPVVLCDHRGLAGFVNPTRYSEWRAQNFGLRALAQPLSKEALLAEIDLFSAAEATNIGQRVRRDCSLEPWVDRYLALYRMCIDRFREQPPAPSHAAIAAHMEKWCSATQTSRRREAALKAPMRAMELTGLMPLATDQPASVNDRSRIALTGFHGQEPWGQWTAKDQAVLTAVRPPSDHPQWLEIEYMPYLSPSMRTRQTLCSINGAPAARWIDEAATAKGLQRRCVPIGEALRESGAVFVSFETSHASSPRADGTGSDARCLGIGIVALTLLDRDTTLTPPEDLDRTAKTDEGLCTVVISYRSPNSLVDAVRSLLVQQDGHDVVVVNSGGGGAQAKLREAGLEVRVIEREARLFPGGARNLGLAATSHRYVAFLASDCLAQPGWVSERLAAHRTGHSAVASALLCHRPRHPIALAAHLTLFCKRMPLVPVGLAQCYGASYDRRLFEQHGPFREDIEGGEDTDFHLRLDPTQRPFWCPTVQTVHRGPSTLRGFVCDQFKRGRRAADAWMAIAGRGRRSFAWGILGRIASTMNISVRVTERRFFFSTLVALPLIALGGAFYAAGALSGRPRTRTGTVTSPTAQSASQ
ncbi:glycosyltransferase [Hydrogenophaga sp. RWCD_12]|uniref:glycosyltransferase n=1 Tax=Hydrogenophaga sp. RWCD_12 TaxID=3391190 RepID=UPI003985093C